MERIQTGIDPAAGINTLRQEIVDDLRAAIETSARERLLHCLRLIGKQAGVIPFDDGSGRTIEGSLKQWRKPRKTPAINPLTASSKDISLLLFTVS
jgi:hypothetical protein